MPFGPSPVVGLCVWTTIKVVGYTLAGRKLNEQYGVTLPNHWKFGVARTLLGVLAGAGTLYVLSRSGKTGRDEGDFLLLLIPIRFCEWFLIQLVFYHKLPGIRIKMAGYSVLGIGWSFLLDIPVIVAMITIPGGIWVC